MSRCTICDNTRLTTINRLVVQGRSLLSVANETGVGYHSLRRHVVNEHIARFSPPLTAPRASPKAPSEIYVFSADENTIHDAALTEWVAVVASSSGLDADALRACWVGVPHDRGCPTCDATEAAAALLDTIEERRQRQAGPYQRGQVMPR